MLRFLLGWRGYVAAALVSGLLASVATFRVMSWREGANEAKFAVQQIKLIDKDLQINLALGDVTIKGLEVINTETVRFVREIPEHVTPEIDRSHPVPLGFVRVWNEQTGGTVPPASAGSDADPSGTNLSAVAYAHATDADTIKRCELGLTAWWQWYDQHSAVRK